MTTYDDLTTLLEQVQRQAGPVATLRSYLDGRPGRAYLNTEHRAHLAGKIDALSVNWPRLIVQAMSDRLRVHGVSRAGDMDAALWGAWVAAGGELATERMIYDRLGYGRAYLTAWTDRRGKPIVLADTPATMAVKTDAATGEILQAVRRWSDGVDSHAALYTAEAMHHYRAKGSGAVAGAGWDLVKTTPHTLRTVPVRATVRRLSADDWSGVSIVEDVLPLVDAQNKLMADMLTTSEYHARPRRWATGLEIREDEEGNPVDPFGDDRFLQSESPETKFGQLPSADLAGYADPIRLLTEQVAAIAGLPPSYLGLHGQQTANAEGTRAAETQLTSRAFNEQRAMSPAVGQVMAIVGALATGRPVTDEAVTPLWESPEVRTPGQAADSAQKLQAIGVPLEVLLSEVMHWSPDSVAKAVAAQRRAALDSLALSLGGQS